MFFQTLGCFLPRCGFPDACISVTFIYIRDILRLMDWTSYGYAYQYIMPAHTDLRWSFPCCRCCTAISGHISSYLLPSISVPLQLNQSISLLDHAVSPLYCQRPWLQVIIRIWKETSLCTLRPNLLLSLVRMSCLRVFLVIVAVGGNLILVQKIWYTVPKPPSAARQLSPANR